MPPSDSASRAAWAIVDASFVQTVHQFAQLPATAEPELAFAGRSNVGKSSLMNMLLGRRKLVRTSSTPGCTRALGFFQARARDGREFQLVDLPGYGYAKRSKAERNVWARLVEAYLKGREALCALVVLVDARHGPTPDDEQLVRFMETSAAKPTVIAVATKLDKVKKSRRRAVLNQYRAALGVHVIGASAVSGEGIETLWRALRAALPEAAAQPSEAE